MIYLNQIVSFHNVDGAHMRVKIFHADGSYTKTLTVDTIDGPGWFEVPGLFAIGSHDFSLKLRFCITEMFEGHFVFGVAAFHGETVVRDWEKKRVDPGKSRLTGVFNVRVQEVSEGFRLLP